VAALCAPTQLPRLLLRTSYAGETNRRREPRAWASSGTVEARRGQRRQRRRARHLRVGSRRGRLVLAVRPAGTRCEARLTGGPRARAFTVGSGVRCPAATPRSRP